MNKRTIIFTKRSEDNSRAWNYNTAENGWTLSAWELSSADYKQHFIDIPGTSAPLDLSTSLTDGEPCYSSRPLLVTLESSEYSRLEREDIINNFINTYNGRRVEITLPDDSTHYLNGRMQIQKLYNDPAHASIQINVICDPYRYSKASKIITLTAAEDEKSMIVENKGTLAVVPTINVSDNVTIIFGDLSWSLSTGKYTIPDILLKNGIITLKYSGTGTITITYREAVL